MTDRSLSSFVWSCIAASLILAALLPYSLWLFDQGTPTTWGLAGLTALGCLFLTCILAGVASLWNWYSVGEVERFERKQYARAHTPYSLAAELTHQLTPEQLAILPRYLAKEEGIGYADQDDDWVQYFVCEYGIIPWEFIHTFLEQSDPVSLMSINTTSDKTPEREFAKALTSYLVDKKFAVPHAGNQPAKWSTSTCYARVCAKFDYDRSPQPID